MAVYKLRAGGVLFETTQTFIPEDALSRYWQEYLLWLQGGGVPDPLPVVTQGARQASALAVLDGQARERLRVIVPGDAAEVWLGRETLGQALAAIADGAPDPGDFLLLDALVPEVGEDALDVAGVVSAAHDARIADVAAIEAERSRVRILIVAATDQSELNAAMASIDWPEGA